MPTTAADKSAVVSVDTDISVRHTDGLLKTGALQRAIFNSANFSSIATDATGVIQIFNVGAERMHRSLAAGYQAHVPKPVDPAELAAAIATIAHHPQAVNLK